MPNTQAGIAQWAEMYPRLTELCSVGGLSAGAIARILNDEFHPAIPLTRHSVIGKVFRHGLRLRPAVKLKVKQQIPQIPQIRQMPPVQTADSFVSIMELNRTHCRWPMAGSGADMRYCGVTEASMPGHPYCNQHAKMAYQHRGG